MKNPLISLVVPCYNEQESLPLLYDELNRVALGMEDYDFEYIFVDDGSTDRTIEILREFADTEPAAPRIEVHYLSFSRNFGKEAAIYAGLSASKGDYVALMDADLQDPPSLLPEMVSYIASGEYDNAATRRVDRKGEPAIRSFFARMFYKIMRQASGIDVADGARDYRLMNRTMVDSILSLSENNRFSKGIFAWVGFKTKWIAFENVERAAGETKWNFWGLFKYSLEGIINFSDLPLKLSSYFGLLLTLISFLAILFVIVRKWIFGDPVSGWPSLVCIIIFMGGIQLFCMGIMGQYIAKMYVETKRRPVYLIREQK